MLPRGMTPGEIGLGTGPHRLQRLSAKMGQDLDFVLEVEAIWRAKILSGDWLWTNAWLDRVDPKTVNLNVVGDLDASELEAAFDAATSAADEAGRALESASRGPNGSGGSGQ